MSKSRRMFFTIKNRQGQYVTVYLDYKDYIAAQKFRKEQEKAYRQWLATGGYVKSI